MRNASEEGSAISSKHVAAWEAARARLVVRILEGLLKASPEGKRILKIGCSTGILMQLLEEEGAEVCGIDVPSVWSDRYAYQPEKRVLIDLQKEEPPPEWEISPFDQVIAQEVLEHLERPYDFLRKVRRMLKPDGYLFLTTPNLIGVTAHLRGRKWCGLATEGHVILYSAKSLDFTVCNCGFRAVRTFSNLVPVYYQARHSWLTWANRALMWTGLGGGLMGLYQKVESPGDSKRSRA